LQRDNEAIYVFADLQQVAEEEDVIFA